MCTTTKMVDDEANLTAANSTVQISGTWSAADVENLNGTLFFQGTDWTAATGMKYLLSSPSLADNDLYVFLPKANGLKLLLASEIDPGAVYIDANEQFVVEDTLARAVASETTGQVILTGAVQERAGESAIVATGKRLQINSSKENHRHAVTGATDVPILTANGTDATGERTDLQISQTYFSSIGQHVIHSEKLETLALELDDTLMEQSVDAVTVPERGGLIFSEGDVEIHGNGTFARGMATQSGGAIYSQGKLTLNGTGSGLIFSENDPDYGGAASADEMQLLGTILHENNAAEVDGGALYQSDAAKTLAIGDGVTSTHVTFNGNTAAQYGGAIYAKGNVVILGADTAQTVVTFVNNTANTAGNDIYTEQNLTLTGNAQATFGGGVTATHLDITDGAEATFGADSISDVADTMTLENATVTFGGLSDIATLVIQGTNRITGKPTTLGNLVIDGTSLAAAQVEALEATKLIFRNASSITGDLSLGSGSITQLEIEQTATANVAGAVTLGAGLTTVLNLGDANTGEFARAVLTSADTLTVADTTGVVVELGDITLSEAGADYLLLSGLTLTAPATTANFSILRNGTAATDVLYSISEVGNTMVLNLRKEKPAELPEPATWVLLLVGLAGVAWRARPRRTC